MCLIAAEARHLTGADIRYTRSHPTFYPPTFENANLILADFRFAVMAGADLRGAKLDGARFCGASGLRTMDVHRALNGSTTRWPRRYEPMAHGADRSGLALSIIDLVDGYPDLSKLDLDNLAERIVLRGAAALDALRPYRPCKRY